MKRYTGRHGHTTMAELNVTPLLDLAFVLLIIFIITTPLLESHIAVNLPTGSATSEPPDAKSIRTVSLDRAGRLYLQEQPTDLARLEAALTEFARDTPDSAVNVRADKSLKFEQVVAVMDVLKRAKIARMNVEEVTP